MEQLLSGKSVLITGVGANIGRHIALEMAAQGAAIYFVDKDAACCTALQTELTAMNVPSRGWTLDVAKPASIEKLQRALTKDNLSIDVLVNNVGRDSFQIDARQEEETSSFEQWRSVFDTNVIGPMALTDWVSQEMVARGQGGCILFLSSIHQWSYNGDAAYSGSKAAVGMIINELALELAPHNIRVNGIAPGFVKLDEVGSLVHHSSTPLHKTAIHPQYIGRAAVYLASDYFSHYTTGTILKIDAGLSLVNYISMLPPPTPPPRHWAHKFARYYRHQWRNLKRRR